MEVRFIKHVLAVMAFAVVTSTIPLIGWAQENDAANGKITFVQRFDPNAVTMRNATSPLGMRIDPKVATLG